eukprot:NODE_120_length_18891_cov_0.302682.p8 type:complete len:167 gc:universal NODE_120_length_18891_cov_0.302682:7796-7296(-)
MFLSCLALAVPSPRILIVLFLPKPVSVSLAGSSSVLLLFLIRLLAFSLQFSFSSFFPLSSYEILVFDDKLSFDIFISVTNPSVREALSVNSFEMEDLDPIAFLNFSKSSCLNFTTSYSLTLSFISAITQYLSLLSALISIPSATFCCSNKFNVSNILGISAFAETS